MMDELSLNILDIAQNSIAAEATLIEIDVEEDDSNDSVIIRIKDNGKGMSREFLETVQDPFTTSRSTRKIGLGISFLKEAAEITGGHIELESVLGSGTTVTALFGKNHIDRQPIGDLTGTIVTLVQLNPSIDFEVRYKVNNNGFVFSTQEVRIMLGEDAELNSPPIVGVPVFTRWVCGPSVRMG